MGSSVSTIDQRLRTNAQTLARGREQRPLEMAQQQPNRPRRRNPTFLRTRSNAPARRARLLSTPLLLRASTAKLATEDIA